MRRCSFVRGARMRVDGRRLRVVSLAARDGVETVTVSDEIHVLETFGMETLQGRYARGELVFEDQDDDGGLSEAELARRRRADDASYALLPEHDRVRIDVRKFVVEHVDRNRCSGMGGVSGRDDLQRLIDEAAAEACKVFGLNALEVSRATYYRWRRALHKRENRMDLRSEAHLRGRRDQVAPDVRSAMLESFGKIFEEARLLGKIQGHPVEVVMKEVVDSLPGAKLPHASTFYRQYERYPAYDRDLVQKGAQYVRAAYRESGRITRPEFALDVVQFDETRLPFLVVHELLGVVLGRPWLAFITDEATLAPVGYSLSFTPPSDELSAAAFRHAVLPKAYMESQYRDLRWRYSGLPRYVVADNGLTQHGFTLASICGNLDIEWEFCPRRTPWAKACVEGFFKRLNAKLLKDLPGFCLPLDSGVSSTDYDPTTHAVMTLSQLDRVLHHFFLGKSYAHQRVATLGASPDQLWSMGVQAVPPEFPAAARDVDLLFAVRRDGRRLDHNGVRFEGLDYWSDDLRLMRKIRGAETRCDIAVDPNTMAHIHVHEHGDVWRKAYCSEPEYARSVTLYQHKLIRKHALGLGGRDDLRARMEARIDLGRHVVEVLTGDHGIRLATSAARFLDVSVDRMVPQLPVAPPELPRAAGPVVAAPVQEQALPVAPPNPALTHDVRRPEIPKFKTSQVLRDGRPK